MANGQQVDEIYALTRLRHKKTQVAALTRINMGIGAVLRYLNESEDKSLTAGELSLELGVSSARVAAILNKMVREDLIVKSRDRWDGRVVTVHMTEHGLETAEYFKSKMKELISKGIDRIGYDRMHDFILTINELWEMVVNDPVCCKAPDEQDGDDGNGGQYAEAD